jgi:hypothetical protein
MTISTYRTIVLPSTWLTATNQWSQPMLQWPVGQVGDVEVDYSIDTTAAIQDVLGFITSVSVSAAPSGSGEITLNSVTVSGDVITVYTTGGAPGRAYTFQIDVGLSDGTTFAIPVSLFIASSLGLGVSDAAPSEGFGPEVTWMSSNNVASPALETGLVLSTVPCQVANIQANTTDVPGWVVLLDATAVPASGAMTPLRFWQVAANTTLNPPSFVPPIQTVNGGALAFTTNASPFTMTPSATALFAGEIG